MKMMKTKNDALEEIGKQFLAAETVLLFPHENMDGDALGSCAALCGILRKMGKKAYILTEGSTPDFLMFLDEGYCTEEYGIIENPDICSTVDCGEVSRFKARRDIFFKGRTKICIDHHATSRHFADYNYIDPDAAATGEIIYKLLNAMNVQIDQKTGEAIYAAINTDTGRFQNANTTRESHEITAALYDCGIDANRVSVEIYETVRPERMKLSCLVLSEMELFADGEAVIACVTQEMLRKTGTRMAESEGIVASLRSVKDVQIAVLLKEKKKEIKVSLRAKRMGNVAEIGMKYGGGGHLKAAGCSLHCPLEEAKRIIMEEVTENLKKFRE